MFLSLSIIATYMSPRFFNFSLADLLNAFASTINFLSMSPSPSIFTGSEIDLINPFSFKFSAVISSISILFNEETLTI